MSRQVSGPSRPNIPVRRFAESEYVVKSDAMEALCRLAFPGAGERHPFGVEECRRVAVQAIGTHGRDGLADAVVNTLDDDVLAEAAADVLVLPELASATAITPCLDAWLAEAEGSARRRVVMRALHVRLHLVPEPAILRHAFDARYPAVRAAAALPAPVPRNGWVTAHRCAARWLAIVTWRETAAVCWRRRPRVLPSQ